MRALIWIIAIFAIAVGVAMLADANEGYMLVVFPPWRAQVSLNLVIVALIVGFIALYLLIRLISKTVNLPGRVGVFRARRRQDKAYNALLESVKAMFEGRFTDSMKQARIAYHAGDSSPVAALLAARAAHALKDDAHYREWMARAAGSGSGRIAGLLTEAELAIDDGRIEEAGRSLEALKDNSHRSSSALRLSMDVARSEGRWEVVCDNVAQLQANKAIAPVEANKLLREAHLGKLRSLTDQPEAQLAYWRSLDKHALADADLVAGAIPLLAAAGQAAVARKVVERVLDTAWETRLARLYVLCSGKDDEASDALVRAERWLASHPDDAGLLYSLGRQCMSAQIWGKAQSYLERSLKLQPSADTHMALGELMEQTGKPADASRYFQAAARQLVGA